MASVVTKICAGDSGAATWELLSIVPMVLALTETLETHCGIHLRTYLYECVRLVLGIRQIRLCLDRDRHSRLMYHFGDILL